MQIRWIGISALLVAAITAGVPADAPAHAGTLGLGRAHAGEIDAMVGLAQGGTLGPFATLRRAMEVAEQYRSRGFNANAYPNGGAYWVRVWR